MRKRLVSTEHHNDEQFYDLSRDARYLYGHLLTHPLMTSFGLIRLTPGGLADECEMERGECVAALEELAAVGRVEVGRRCLALAESYLETPANPSVVTGWGKIIDLLPHTPLVHRRLRQAVDGLKRRARDAGEKGTNWTDAIPENLRERLTSPPVTTSKPVRTKPTASPAASTIEQLITATPATSTLPEKKPAKSSTQGSTVKRFPVVVAGGSAEPVSPSSVKGSTVTGSTHASVVYTSTSGSAAALAVTTTAEPLPAEAVEIEITPDEPLMVDPATIEIEPLVEEPEDDDLLDADELFALVDAPELETVPEIEPAAEIEPSSGFDDSPYSLPPVGLFPSPEPPTLPDLAELVNPSFVETAGEGVGHGARHGVKPAVHEGPGHLDAHAAEEGLTHGFVQDPGHGAEHGVGEGVAHSILHSPVSIFHSPCSKRSRLAPERAGARGQAREARDGDFFSQQELEFEFEVEDADGNVIELWGEPPGGDPPIDDPPVVEYFDEPSPPPMEQAEPDPDPEPEASSDPDPDPWPEPKPEPESQLEPEPPSKPVPETGSEPDLDSEPSSETGPEPIDPSTIDLDPDTESAYQRILAKAEGILGRNLEVEELGMLRTWCRDIPQRLIEYALADGVRAKIRRLAWVGKRLETLVAGHLAKHPELAEDDLREEQADALQVLSDDRLAGHLSEMTRKLASAAVRKATSARQVRDILDQALES